MIAPVYRSARTKEIYERALIQLRVAFKVAPNDFDFLQKSKEVIEHIEGLDKAVNSKKIYYIAIVGTLMRLEDPGFTEVLKTYKEKQAEYNSIIQKQYETQQMTPEQMEKFLSWPSVLEARKKIGAAAHDLMTYQDYVLVCVYTYIPPVRADFAHMRVVYDEAETKEGNCLLVLSSGLTLVLNEFKTAHKYGQARIAVPPALEEILRNWMELNPSGWLFCDSEGRPLTECGLSRRIIQIFQRHTGKDVGISMLRHSFVSWVRKDEPSYLEQKRVAEGMLHSVGINQLYRITK